MCFLRADLKENSASHEKHLNFSSLWMEAMWMFTDCFLTLDMYVQNFREYTNMWKWLSWNDGFATFLIDHRWEYVFQTLCVLILIFSCNGYSFYEIFFTMRKYNNRTLCIYITTINWVVLYCNNLNTKYLTLFTTEEWIKHVFRNN